MKKQKHFLVLFISLLLLAFSGVTNANVLTDFKDSLLAKSNGLKFMANGQYKLAIIEFEKISKKQDPKLQKALIECYLRDNRDNDADRVAYAVSQNYKNISDEIASIYLKTIKGCKVIAICDRRLKMVDHLATSPANKHAAGHLEKAYASHFSGNKRKELLSRAVHHLGHKAVFGFEVQRIDALHVKVTFFTDKPVKIMDWEKGKTITFVSMTNPMQMLTPGGNSNYMTIPINFPITSSKNTSLTLIGKTGSHVIIKQTT